MSLSRSSASNVTALARSSRSALRIAVLLLATAPVTAGCSSRPAHHQNYSGVGADPHARPAAEASRRIDMEEDGMEAQVPPPPSIRVAPDDPSEPWSPNYGSRPAGAPGSPPAEPQSRPNQPPKPPAPGRSKFASYGHGA